MAHNLNEVNGKVAFASNAPAWHGLGSIVDNPLTMREAVELGGLDYEVEKKALYLADQSIVPGSMATVRTDTNDVLGVVGDNYQVVQNTEVFGFFDSLLGQENVRIQTVGALGKGERIFVTAKLPHEITVSNSDLTEMYVILSNTHDGSGAVVAGLTPIRVVCQNTLNFAINRGLSNRIGIRHTQNAKINIERAGEIMKTALRFSVSVEEAFNVLYRTKVSDGAAKQLIKMVVQGDSKGGTRMDNILEKIETVYHTGIGQEKIIGTAWGVFNGITHYLSHNKEYHTQETKFNSLLLNGVSEKQTKSAFDYLMAYAAKGDAILN